MSAVIHRLAYISRLTDFATAALPRTVEDILICSSRNNARAAITGLLLCDGVEFAQVIEGPRAAVDACFGRILADERHGEIMLRLKEDAPGGRMFRRWSMCGLSLTLADSALLPAPDLAMDLATVAPGALLQHLSGLATRHAEHLDALHDRLMAERFGGRASWAADEPGEADEHAEADAPGQSGTAAGAADAAAGEAGAAAG